MVVKIIIVLNNFINDLGVAFVFVTGGASFILARRALKDDKFRALNLFVCSKLKLPMVIFLLFALGGAVLRYSTMDQTEWVDAVSHGQTLAFGAKYVILSTCYVFGFLLWLYSRRLCLVGKK